MSTIIRGFLASAIELGNDEVYYWTYALYPDWSHYDHPPMIGLLIQLFSFNLSIDSAFFIRLGSIISASLCSWLIFLIAKEIKNEQVGLISVLLYTSSFYAMVIGGIFILPDAPLCLFWLLSVFLMLKIIKAKDSSDKLNTLFVYLGFSIALAVLSKYSGILLWLAFVAYLCFFDRSKIRRSSFLIFNLICIFGVLPILYWNVTNDFGSFQYHSGRIGFELFNMNLFFKEVGGEFIYHNPIVYSLILLAILNWWRRRLNIQPQYIRLLFFISLPLIFMVFTISFFKPSLPHWSGPAYLTLLVIPAIYIQQKLTKNKYLLIILCLFVMIAGLSLAYLQIKTGIVKLDSHESEYKKGMNDPTLDLFGWEQLADKFKLIYNQELKDGLITEKAMLISDRWFPSAHLDYYIAKPLDLNLFVMGSKEDIHKYYWINQQRKSLNLGEDAYFITLSTMYSNPAKHLSSYFERIELMNRIPILRKDEIVKYAFVYKLHRLKKVIP